MLNLLIFIYLCLNLKELEKKDLALIFYFMGQCNCLILASLNFHIEATKIAVLQASKGFRENMKSKPIYSGHILDQCLEN